MVLMVSRNGIYYDLARTVYKYKTPDTNMTFYFSSDLHLMKFEERYIKHREEQNTKLKARFRLNLKFNTLADILLYKKIETRGFLIVNEGGIKICQENLILGGEKATPKS